MREVGPYAFLDMVPFPLEVDASAGSPSQYGNHDIWVAKSTKRRAFGIGSTSRREKIDAQTRGDGGADPDEAPVTKPTCGSDTGPSGNVSRRRARFVISA